MNRTIRNVGTALVAIAANAVAAKAFGAYTEGDLVVLQVGLTGSDATLASSGTALQLDEFTTGGSSVMTEDLPTVASGSNNPITISGTAGSEGALNLSTNGQYLVIAGYDVGVGGATQGESTVGLVNAAGTVNTFTTSDLEAGNNTRSATSVDGTEVWLSGATEVVAIPTGTSGGTTVNTRNSRDVMIAPASVSPTGSNQLYTSGNSSSHTGIFSDGTGTPAGAGSATGLPGLSGTVEGTYNPFGFFFANPTTLFVADATYGLQEWTESGGTWTNSATLSGDSYVGLTGVQNGNTVTLYATDGTSSGISAENSLISDVFTFNSGTTGAGTFSAPDVLATAGPNTEFGGVAFAPSNPSPPIWDGTGSDDNWTTGANWGGTAPAAGALLEFAGNTQLSNNSNFTANTQFDGIQFDASAGAFVLSGNAVNLDGNVLNSSASSQTININLALEQNASINAAAGNITIGGAISGGFSLNTPGSNVVTLTGSNSYSGGTNVSAGKLVIGAAGALPADGSVSITGGSLQLALNTGGETLSSLSISAGGVLDLGNNHIVLSDPGGSIDTTIRGYLSAGYNNGNWNGASATGGSIITSSATGTQYGIGYADGADGGISGITSGQLEVKYTLYGDTNLDGAVNSVDFGNLAANFGKSGKVWDQGDFNYDGTVNSIDFGLLAGNFGKSVGGDADVVTASDWAALDAFAAANGLMADVPEPASASLALLAGVSILARRRRSTKR